MKKSFLTKILSIGVGFSSLFGGRQTKAIDKVESQKVQQQEEQTIINEVNNNANQSGEYFDDLETNPAEQNQIPIVETTVDEPVSDKSRAIALGLAVLDFFTLGIVNTSYLYQGKIAKGIINIPIFGWYKTVYNFGHILAGSQKDAEGKVIKKWW